MSYDVWGVRRDPVNWFPSIANNEPVITNLGFTGHEHLDKFSLINMNGRVYDPVIARFISPDPIIQTTAFAQGLNCYAYCMNNPLSLVDPSGYSWLSENWKPLVSSIVAITVAAVATVATSGAALGVAIFAGTLGGMAGGVTSAILNGGSFNDVMAAGLVGAALGGLTSIGAGLIGGAFVGPSISFLREVGRAVAHGMFNGGMRILQGGKFLHGFLSGSFSSLVGSAVGGAKLSFAGSTAVGAALGGTAEALGGGKFANGAITGAYTMLFNHLAQHLPKKLGKGLVLTRDESISEGDAGGAIIELLYYDEGTGYSDFRWVQTIETTNPDPNKTSPYIDTENSPPFYYDDAEVGKHIGHRQSDLQIFDRPKRGRFSGVSWIAEVSVVGMDGSGNYHRIATVKWGFSIDQSGKTIKLNPMLINNPSNFHLNSLPN